MIIEYKQIIEAQLTFGTKTRQRVIVVLKMMKRLMITKAGVGWSLIMNEMAAPQTKIITTL